MTEERLVVREIDWKSIIPFTLLFRSFRIAIHPSKLALALLALAALWGGGNVLDSFWLAEYRAVPNEVSLYDQAQHSDDPAAEFRSERDSARAAAQGDFDARLAMIGKPGGTLADIKYQLVQTRKLRVDDADAFMKSALMAPNLDAARQASIRADHDQRVARAYREAADEYAQAAAVGGVGLFSTLADFELGCVYRVVNAAPRGDFLSNDGVSGAVIGALWVGPLWAVRHHAFYFAIYGIYALAIWSIFGGAITRIAAVHVARDEKISIRQALAFSAGKFLSFFSAPLIPLILALLAGAALAIGGIVANVPFIGPIIVGAAFFIALIVGFVITLILLGAIGGFNLMYPTISVEGSDSFDAISRSFSYVYARPWRLAIYTLVAIIYGAITFLFVRFFLTLLLSVTHFFVGALIFTHADDATPLWNQMWSAPEAHGRLVYTIDYMTLGPGSGASIGASLLAIWIYLAIGLLGAFAISFHFSANTIIYYLMRREVDATEIDDVYLEQSDEDFAEPAADLPATAVPETPAADAAPAADSPIADTPAS